MLAWWSKLSLFKRVEELILSTRFCWFCVTRKDLMIMDVKNCQKRRVYLGKVCVCVYLQCLFKKDSFYTHGCWLLSRCSQENVGMLRSWGRGKAQTYMSGSSVGGIRESSIQWGVTHNHEHFHQPLSSTVDLWMELGFCQFEDVSICQADVTDGSDLSLP